MFFYRLMLEMTEYYTKNYRKMNLKEVKILAYCAVYDGDCYYRGLFLNLIEVILKGSYIKICCEYIKFNRILFYCRENQFRLISCPVSV